MSIKHMTQEEDIGSGERSPGARETEKEIRKVSPTIHQPSSTEQQKNSQRKEADDAENPSSSQGN